MKIYLAGPINGCTDEECKDWREAAKLALKPHECIDPMRRDYRGREAECVTEIVEGDKFDIAACNMFLANCPKPSYGTAMEMLLASQLGKRVIVVIPKDAAISPWVRYHSDEIHHVFSEAFQSIKASVPGFLRQ